MWSSWKIYVEPSIPSYQSWCILAVLDHKDLFYGQRFFIIWHFALCQAFLPVATDEMNPIASNYNPFDSTFTAVEYIYMGIRVVLGSYVYTGRRCV